MTILAPRTNAHTLSPWQSSDVVNVAMLGEMESDIAICGVVHSLQRRVDEKSELVMIPSFRQRGVIDYR